MKKVSVVSIIFVVIISLLAIFTGCDMSPGDNSGSEGLISAYTVKGDVAVQAETFDSSETFVTKLFGDTEGTFTPKSISKRNVGSRAADEEYYFQCSNLLKRFDEEDTFVSFESYSFSSFKVVADIFLRGDAWWSGYEDPQRTILNWGGDPEDLSNYVDLATGEFVSTDNSTSIQRSTYTSILIQLNAPAETLIPDFGEDIYEQETFSWEDIKPFHSTSSSAQHIILSTYIDKPFAKWLGGDAAGIENYTTVQEYNSSHMDEITEFGQWAFSAPLNQEFFDAVKALEHTQDPCSGEAWLFLPLHESIDLTSISNVSFSFEFFMKDLFEVYIDEDSNANYILSVGKSYTDQDENVFYAPLPIKATYFENDDGFSVVD